MLRIISVLTFVVISSNLLFAVYPSKPITIIVDSKPGSGIDITFRQFSKVDAKYIDVPILVENKTGASGIIAMDDASIFMTRPVSLAMLILALLSFFYPIVKPIIEKN